MSLKAQYQRAVAFGQACLDKVNGAPQPLREIVQAELDRGYADARHRHDWDAVAAFQQAGGRFNGQSDLDASTEAEKYLAPYRAKTDFGFTPEINQILSKCELVGKIRIKLG